MWSSSLPAQQQTVASLFRVGGLGRLGKEGVFQMEMQQSFCCPSFFCLLLEPPPTHCLAVSPCSLLLLLPVILRLSRDSDIIYCYLSVVLSEAWHCQTKPLLPVLQRESRATVVVVGNTDLTCSFCNFLHRNTATVHIQLFGPSLAQMFLPEPTQPTTNQNQRNQEPMQTIQ